MAAAKEKRVPKWYFDEVFSMGVLFRKKTRTRKTFSAVDKIGKREKTHYVEIFGIFEISFFIFIASLCIFELFLKLLSLGNWILQRLFLRSLLPSFTDLQIIRRESTNLSSHLTYLNRSQTWRYRNVLTPFEFGGKIEIPTCMHKRAKTYSWAQTVIRHLNAFENYLS